jgi:predicted P-loop ATPase
MTTQNAILDKAIAVLVNESDETKQEYLKGIAQRWEKQEAVDYMAKGLLGT